MDLTTPHPPAHSATRLPAGVAILPRKPRDTKFEEVPRDWFAWSRFITTAANLFSLIIPAHERFFIRTVREYKKGISDREAADLVQAFMLQEAIHYQVHEEFNQTRADHGMDIARDSRTIKAAFARLEKRFSLKMRLGMTAYMEHCTAIAAHLALSSPIAGHLHPTMRQLWEWHAIEEIEHKCYRSPRMMDIQARQSMGIA